MRVYVNRKQWDCRLIDRITFVGTQHESTFQRNVMYLNVMFQYLASNVFLFFFMFVYIISFIM